MSQKKHKFIIQGKTVNKVRQLIITQGSLHDRVAAIIFFHVNRDDGVQLSTMVRW